MSLEEPKKTVKHVSILVSIGRLTMVRKELQALLNEIVGDEENKAKEQKIQCPKDPTQTLLSVLNDAGNQIIEEAEKISGITLDMRNQLF